MVRRYSDLSGVRQRKSLRGVQQTSFRRGPITLQKEIVSRMQGHKKKTVMAKQLSKIQIAAYLEDPELCPFCQSDSITAGYTDYSGTFASRYISCNDCKENFFENFKMTSLSQLEFDEDDFITEEETYIVVEQQTIVQGIWNENNIYIKDNGD